MNEDLKKNSRRKGKMTDKQIIKALRCWTGKTVKDEECAECSFGEDCTLGEIVNAAEKRINELAAENAALRARLERAVELPCRVGTTVYGVGFFDCEDAYTEDETKKREIFHHCMKMNGDCEKCKYRRPSIEEFVCTHIQIGACGLDGQKILIVGEKNENYTRENIFLTREAAEARLAELKGGKE